ncbi:MAG: hypothetical protein WD155_02180, partial [Burkholderiales bacterium]
TTRAMWARNSSAVRAWTVGWVQVAPPAQSSASSAARILSRRLAEAGIRHRYEEFDDDRSDIDYRMDASLPFLHRALR